MTKVTFCHHFHDRVDNNNPQEAHDDEREVASEVDPGPVGQGRVYPQQEEAHAQVVKPSHPHKPAETIVDFLTLFRETRSYDLLVIILNLNRQLFDLWVV